MQPPDAAIPHDPAALARAYLALVEAGDEPLPSRHTAPRSALALLVAVTVALSLPLLWASVATKTVAEHAAATVPHKPSLVADVDDQPAGE